MSPADLLRALEPLTHDARIRRMVELGRAAASDSAIAATLGRPWAAAASSERMLALDACHGSRDGAHRGPGRVRPLAPHPPPLVAVDRPLCR